MSQTATLIVLLGLSGAATLLRHTVFDHRPRSQPSGELRAEAAIASITDRADTRRRPERLAG